MEEDEKDLTPSTAPPARREGAPGITETIRKSLSEGSSGGGMPDELLLVQRDGAKMVRFLAEFDKAVPVIMHDKWEILRPQPCLKYYDEPCPVHVEAFRSVTWYVWTVWDYESQSKRVAMWKPTLASPVEDLLDLFDTNGTIMDRDIELRRMGTGTKSRWKIRAQAPTPFEGKLSKPFSEEKTIEILKGLVTKRTLEEAGAKPKSGAEEE
jgi:hypothetical protein